MGGNIGTVDLERQLASVLNLNTNAQRILGLSSLLRLAWATLGHDCWGLLCSLYPGTLGPDDKNEGPRGYRDSARLLRVSCWWKKLLKHRETVVESTVGVWEHTDNWLKAQICAVLEPNTNAQRIFWLSFLLFKIRAHLRTIVTVSRAVSNRESWYPRGKKKKWNVKFIATQNKSVMFVCLRTWMSTSKQQS